ncbi:hypothetical protein IV203_009179 [Nitzschia inconspicua]|uniref:Uncharacterized protein n=1 Tax=Nitzschia inconspicua TaxID=303405 RepID=A0A9K3L1N1_9STRA|nr:hypothetical protein IV203_009179 [Nitzschia inconspicua]
MKFSLVVLAVAAPLTASFTVEPAGVSKILTPRTSLDMVKGFGKDIEKTPQKIKSQAQMERERASSQYDKIASSGGQEYAIFCSTVRRR